jgi:hypothetical protein
MQMLLWWRVWWGLAESAFGGSVSLESGGWFCVDAFSRKLTLVAVKMFLHLMFYFKKRFYKCCGFNVICEDNVSIHCITTQHKNGSFPSTLTGHMLG